ncbi:MAG TPA: hypothetical protein VGM56_16700, partial [Byssovorax sp.]
MEQSRRTLTELGRHVAELQDSRARVERDGSAGRARFLAAASAHDARGASAKGEARRARLFASLAAAAVLCAALVVVFARGHEALRFEL